MCLHIDLEGGFERHEFRVFLLPGFGIKAFVFYEFGEVLKVDMKALVLAGDEVVDEGAFA